MSTVALDHQLYNKPGNNEKDGAVLILHGLFGSKRNWNTLAQGFSKSLDKPIYTLDLRNHGTSPHQHGMTYAEMAQDVLEFIDKHDLKQTTIIGHSMGGKVAMAVALDPYFDTCKDLLQNLIVVDIAPVKAGVSEEFRGYAEAMLSIENGKMKTRKHADMLLSAFESDSDMRAFLLTNLGTATTERPYVKFRIPINIIQKALPDIGDFSYSPGERVWEGRTLFIKGAESPYINHHGIPLIQSFFPNYMLESLGTGHLVHAEQPAEFKQLVEKFLAIPTSSPPSFFIRSSP
ncbi:Abhydrolase domain-containing protein C22H12.03 [Leucoagaricus sp. SymC.cos]|nr:Abhydrolase domain-containing protein C22H12.03 [Leucoagaricus sp. SymC.cos]